MSKSNLNHSEQAIIEVQKMMAEEGNKTSYRELLKDDVFVKRSKMYKESPRGVTILVVGSQIQRKAFELAIIQAERANKIVAITGINNCDFVREELTLKPPKLTLKDYSDSKPDVVETKQSPKDIFNKKNRKRHY